MKRPWLLAAISPLIAWALVGCGPSPEGPASPPMAVADEHLHQTSQPAQGDSVKNPPRPAAANRRCPMMGRVIGPAEVSDSLVQEYKGHPVAFCCGSCPDAWDMLTDAGKDSMLRAAESHERRLATRHP